MCKEIQDTAFVQFGDARDNIEIGQYTERLETAKATLDALGDQGVLTAEQLEAVNAAFTNAKNHLDASTNYYGGYGWGDASSYDLELAEDAAKEAESKAIRYQSAMEHLQEENSTLQNRISELESQLSQKTYGDGQTGSIEGYAKVETESLEILRNKLLEVKNAVDAKTQAFEEEYVTVDAAVQAEISSIQELIKGRKHHFAK